MLFSESSEFSASGHQGTFIVQVYEKLVKKRQGKPKNNKRVKGMENMRRMGRKRHATDQLLIRESKMRRFCNYWMILFNVRNLKPFTQFIKADEIKEFKLIITAKVHELLKGSEAENRGRLERCASKISEFSLANGKNDNDSSPLKTPKGKLRLTKEMILQAQEVWIDPETRIGNSQI